jgi:elongator complex protein 3
LSARTVSRFMARSMAWSAMDRGVQPRSRGPALDFEPAQHRPQLMAALSAIAAEALRIAERPLPKPVMDAILRRHPRAGRGFFSRSELIAGYRMFATECDLDEQEFLACVQMRPVRTQSGVTPVTVLTKPYPCPGKCVFCPNDVRMPKSYLSDEPGCQRAESNDFDPYRQTYSRLLAFRAIGHPTDKAELIVLGGTFSFYPRTYRIWFIKRCVDAMNDFGAGRDGREAGKSLQLPQESLDGRTLGAGYNRVVMRWLERTDAAAESASLLELRSSQLQNERSNTRNVGLALETRPDHIDEAEVRFLRELGCTKVQLGFQSLNDVILSANKRGHDVAATRRAVKLLRQAGFKLLAHVMPNLLGATPQSDIEDFARVFDDPDFRPDELKVYPCSLIESAELMLHYERGEYRPYDRDQLAFVLREALAKTPRYCRLVRMVRDISSGDIVAGNRLSNFREIAERELLDRGGKSVEIRSREIRGGAVGDGGELRTTEYETSCGRERFIEFVTAEDRILGFCRLTLPQEPSFMGEIARSALLREVHVYGASLGLGVRDAARAQHRGLGSALIEEAGWQARLAGFVDLAVISAVGTREYYRGRGFVDGALYQHRAL